MAGKKKARGLASWVSGRGDVFKFCEGGGRHDTPATAYLDRHVGEAEDSCGDTEGGSIRYRLFYGPFGHPQLRKFAGAITEDDGAAMGSEFFASRLDLDRMWDAIWREVRDSEEDA